MPDATVETISLGTPMGNARIAGVILNQVGGPRHEAKLREVETELEVAQASTDMIATGVLDYSLAPEAEDEEGAEPLLDEADMTQTAT